MNNFFKHSSSDESIKAVNIIWDWHMNLFKRYALGLPGTQFRNLMGIVWNNFIQGIVNPAAYAKTIYYMATKNPIIEEAGMIGAKGGFFTKATALARELPGMESLARKGFKSINPLSPEFVPIRLMRGLMSNMEDWGRIMSYIYHREQGWAPSMAMLKVMESQFDYNPQEYTAAVNFMRKYTMPFFAWTFNNLPYQLEALLKQPDRK